MSEPGEERAQEQSKSKLPGWIVGGIGVFLLLLAANIIPQRHFQVNVPSAVLAVVAFVLIFGAAAVLVGLGTPASSRCVAASMLLMAITFLWIAVFGDARHMSGGIPFVPRWLDVYIFRFVFALAALGFFAIAVSAWRYSGRQAKIDDG